MKSEPSTYSIEHFKKEKTCVWDGVRNYQARNIMRDKMQKGDLFFFYHSNTKPPGIAGLGVVKTPAAVDPTQFIKASDYYDPKSTKENPRWHCAEVQYKKTFKTYVSLDELRQHKKLEGMKLLQKGARLSVQPVTEEEFEYILGLVS